MRTDARTASCDATNLLNQLYALTATLQCSAARYEMRSASEQLRFDTSRTGLVRIGSVGYSVALMSDQQSQGIAGNREKGRNRR